MHLPQHIFGPHKTVHSSRDVDLFIVSSKQVGSLIHKDLITTTFLFFDCGESFFNGLPEKFHPGNDIQELCDGQIGQIVSLGTTNLLQNLARAHMCHTSRPENIDGPERWKAGNHGILHHVNFCHQFSGSSQYSRILFIHCILLVRIFCRLHVDVAKYFIATHFKVFVELGQSGCTHIGKVQFTIALIPKMGVFVLLFCSVLFGGLFVYFHGFNQSHHASRVLESQLKSRGNATQYAHTQFFTHLPHILHMFRQKIVHVFHTLIGIFFTTTPTPI
mmetsp:Transcript_22352/g.40340  ORF Transcript_22352/g.40340 Transcript_22352/m.40340 type:complete len:275 (-) Transcript_22352:1065-1889(-)